MKQQGRQAGGKTGPSFSWADIDTVLLDMDGTLLDKHFDDYFWEQYVPEHYSLVHDIPVARAREELLARYRSVENTLDWTDLDYWSRELGLDIPELKLRINHLIGVHPHVVEFLEYCLRRRKRLYLVTNAHPRTLCIKLEKTSIGPWFDRIICASEVGLAKEVPAFWQRLQEMLGYDPGRTMLADDTEKVLDSARGSGMGLLVFVARPSSRQQPRYSARYPSIDYFKELVPVRGDRVP
ncbi:MAG TPA: haloacid dehalogenase [Desulfobulbus sp.]|nr:haloacid dehalogenase [Desulfobulbus sp.]